METRRRSIAKAVSYRFVGSVGTAMIAWALTGRLSTGVQIGILDALVKVAAYFVHERIWARIEWGRRKGPEYEI